ncbi:spermidine hydroxycinnamoyl transferase-like [Abrus precatorius]|uniref:Spermidine hydroxycinnamoyl transferase-like n=1 Tax=Abrus precatorius TaxID=3816 RepID=A0A8B8KE86_ABRPR|nr:spermidine hydroxycinnamoyl transferase-like [Abrus precatorius]
MATIKASYTIIPNEPTPNGRLWLSDYDHYTRPGHTPLIYIYRAKHIHKNAIERMRSSLSKILVHYYPIAGRLSLTQSGRIELDCNTKGVTLLEAESTKSFDEYGDFSPSMPIKELVPTIDYTQPIESLPLLFIQVTRFQGDQGLAIGLAVSHPVGDGITWIHFLNSWAKVAKGDTLEPHEMPFLDRKILKFPHQTSPPHFDHPELKTLPLLLGKYDSIDEQKKKTSSILLKLTSNQVEILKKMANDGSMKEGSRPYSRYEAIVAHIWRCASKARELDENQPTIVRFNVNFRNIINPPLPRNYFGNVLAPTVTPTCYVGDIISNPLSYAAQKIREATELLTNEYIRSQMSVIVGEEKLDCIKALFLGQGEHGNAPFGGNPNLHITSWMSMEMYEADFGWGKPVYFGLGYLFPQDRGIVILSPEERGSIIVNMHFQIAHIPLFKRFFYEDIFTSRL